LKLILNEGIESTENAKGRVERPVQKENTQTSCTKASSSGGLSIFEPFNRYRGLFFNN